MSTELSTVVHVSSLGDSPEGFVGVGFWVRAGGRFLDWVVHYVVWFASTFLFAIGVGVYAGITDTDVAPLSQKLAVTHWYAYLAALLGGLMYHTVMERMCGATVGKRLLGLVVVRLDGGPIGFRAALGRSLAFYIDSFLFGLPAWDAMKPPLQQRLGDQWCDTLVIRRSTLPRASPVAGLSFAVALLCGLAVDGACCWLSDLVKVL